MGAGVPAKYEQIKRMLKDRIFSGELPEGAPVLSERELSIHFGVTRNQTRQALRELELEGYLERSQGRRSIVAPMAKRYQPIVIGDKATLAIAIQDQQTRHTQRILEGFMRAAGAVNYQTVAFNLYFDRDGEPDFLERIRSTGVTGLAFWPHHDQPRTREVLWAHRQSGFPVVLLDRYLPGLDMDAVVSDNLLAGRLLTEALLTHGHSRIAFLTEENDSSSAQERFAGCLEAHAARNIPFDKQRHVVIHGGHKHTAAAVCALFACKQRPTGLVCVHDRLAEAAGKELKRLGYSVPGDVGIASLGDEQRALNGGPPMWTLEQPSVDIGRKAFELLHARLDDPERAARCYRLPPVPESPVAVYPQAMASAAVE